MLSLVAISNSACAPKIESLLTSILRIKVVVSTDVNKGLQEVLSKRPEIVCIQNKMPDITAEDLARHIQRLSGGKAPRFVLLHEGADGSQPVKGLVEQRIDLNLPPASLRAAAASTFKAILGSEWDECKSQQEASREEAGPDDVSSFAGALDDVWSSAPPDAPPPGDLFQLPTTAGEPQGRFSTTFTPSGRGRGRTLALAAALAIVAAAGCWFLVTEKPELLAFWRAPAPPAALQRQKSSRPGSSTTAPRYPIPAKKLPAFIPADGRDAAYGEEHPGWERYLGDDYECRVFKEGNRVKAVQVLGVENDDLGKDLLKNALLELVGESAYSLTSQSTKDGYSTMTCMVGKKADLLIYARGSKISAFVISLN